AIAVSQRITDAVGQRIAESRGIQIGYFQIRWPEQRRFHRQLGILVLNPHLRWRKLRPLELRHLATIHWSRRVVVCSSASAGFVGARGELRDVRRYIQERDVHFVLRLDCGNNMPSNGNHEQSNNGREHGAKGSPREGRVLVLANLYGPLGKKLFEV